MHLLIRLVCGEPRLSVRGIHYYVVFHIRRHNLQEVNFVLQTKHNGNNAETDEIIDFAPSSAALGSLLSSSQTNGREPLTYRNSEIFLDMRNIKLIKSHEFFYT